MLAPQAVPKGLGIVTADLNRDGSSDLVIRWYDDTSQASLMRILYSRGDGTFALGGDLRPPAGAFRYVANDVNRDGWLDIVISHYRPAGVSVTYGDESGTWQGTEFYPTSRGASTVEVGDFNEDGRPDIVAATELQKLAF